VGRRNRVERAVAAVAETGAAAAASIAAARRVVGVDIATGGWAAAVVTGGAIADVVRVRRFRDLLAFEAEVIAVDVPIGIPERDARPADAAARRFVGPRASTVFTTPVRAVLEAATYAEARARAVELTGKSVSAQAYHLRHAILEVDEHARADERIIEVHPEVSFRELAGRALESKHTPRGLEQRRELLVGAGIALPDAAAGVKEIDLLDAAAAAWSAARYARGQALALPEGHAGRVGAIWR
jgi:predicted RNase H-like nuclease